VRFAPAGLALAVYQVKRGRPSMQFRRILLPTDFSETSQLALECAASLAHDNHGELLILHAVETLGPENLTYGEAGSQLQPEAYRRRLLEDLEGIKPSDKELKVEYLVVEGDPVQAILKSAAERGCDLIVMGSHGRSGLKRLLLGSVAEKVIRKAICPVLVVKSHAAQAAESDPVT
jgi:nucleotide-binding universal stress UspA family protein